MKSNKTNEKLSNNDFITFVKEIKEKILSAQYEALKKVNKELINLYWGIGKNIVEKQKQYGWGKSVVQNLSLELQKEFVGIKGFSVQNLWNMRQFYLEYYKNEKLQTLSREIGWSHNVVIFQKCKDDLQREFYIKSVIKFGWTYRVLDNQIDNQTYEKYLLNQTNFDKTLPQKYKHQAKFAVKDEYNYDFLELSDNHNEYELELKAGSFKPEYAGKMSFYLSVLNDKVKLEDENSSIGIIICKEKNRTIVEYALKEANQPIGVATYKTTQTLPQNFKEYLPSAKEIEDNLVEFLEGTNETKDMQSENR